MRLLFPFSAIVGQDELKLAILTAAIGPGVGGVLVFGGTGSGKSMAVRALAGMLNLLSQNPDVKLRRFGVDDNVPDGQETR